MLSSAENIAKLLQNWMKNSPKSSSSNSSKITQVSLNNNLSMGAASSSSPSEGTIIMGIFKRSASKMWTHKGAFNFAGEGLLDDANAQAEQERSLNGIALSETADLF
ncbi:Transcription factor [Datura stramonium]|uniref:Transcription factor n=1 Tax=Datura stramonium TaxID=4076 RepID=A0ABS8SGK5_DATST|nr:Transcription factor [Datura stramonium]